MANMFLVSPRAVGGLVPPPSVQSASDITMETLSAGVLYAHKLKKLKTSVSPDVGELCTAQDLAETEVYIHKSASTLGAGDTAGVMNAITKLGKELHGRLDALDGRLVALGRRVDGVGHQVHASSLNQNVRLYNNRAFGADFNLRPLKKEVPHPAPPAGAAPQLVPNVGDLPPEDLGFPRTKGQARTLTATALDALQQFYQEPFTGGTVDERRLKFQVFIGMPCE